MGGAAGGVRSGGADAIGAEGGAGGREAGALDVVVAEPHPPQKRALAGTWPPQLGQNIAILLVNSLRVPRSSLSGSLWFGNLHGRPRVLDCGSRNSHPPEDVREERGSRSREQVPRAA